MLNKNKKLTDGVAITSTPRSGSRLKKIMVASLISLGAISWGNNADAALGGGAIGAIVGATAAAGIITAIVVASTDDNNGT